MEATEYSCTFFDKPTKIYINDYTNQSGIKTLYGLKKNENIVYNPIDKS